jgi:hypothetical protein
MMDVRKIISVWLEQNGFDGLGGGSCGCGLDDLMPCNQGNIGNCKPAKRHECKDMTPPFSFCHSCEAGCYGAEKETAHAFIVEKDPVVEPEGAHS